MAAPATGLDPQDSPRCWSRSARTGWWCCSTGPRSATRSTSRWSTSCTPSAPQLEQTPEGPDHRRHRRRLRLRRGHRPAARTPPGRRPAGHQLHHFCPDRQAAHARHRGPGRLLPGRRRRTGLRRGLPDRHPVRADRQPGNRPGHPRRGRRQLAPEGTRGGAGGQGNPAGRRRAARRTGPRRQPHHRDPRAARADGCRPRPGRPDRRPGPARRADHQVRVPRPGRGASAHRPAGAGNPL